MYQQQSLHRFLPNAFPNTLGQLLLFLLSTRKSALLRRFGTLDER